MKRIFKNKRTVAFLAIAILASTATISIWYALVRLNQPVEGQLTVGKDKPAQNEYAIDLSPKAEHGTHVSFTYPTGMTSQERQSTSPTVESFFYTAKDLQTWALAINVSSLPTGELTSNSSFMLRKNNPAQFDESQETINGMEFVIMTDRTADGFSKVAFTKHGAYMASISLIGNHAGSVQPLQQAFDATLQSWEWQ